MDIGAFCGVQVDALQFALQALTQKSILLNTEFVIHTHPLLLHCRTCDNDYAADPDDVICPGCMKADFAIRQGQEMIVKAILGEKKVDG